MLTQHGLPVRGRGTGVGANYLVNYGLREGLTHDVRLLEGVAEGELRDTEFGRRTAREHRFAARYREVVGSIRSKTQVAAGRAAVGIGVGRPALRSREEE